MQAQKITAPGRCPQSITRAESDRSLGERDSAARMVGSSRVTAADDGPAVDGSADDGAALSSFPAWMGRAPRARQTTVKMATRPTSTADQKINAALRARRVFNGTESIERRLPTKTQSFPATDYGVPVDPSPPVPLRIGVRFLHDVGGPSSTGTVPHGQWRQTHPHRHCGRESAHDHECVGVRRQRPTEEPSASDSRIVP